jgi:SAM-dependent methyltransferase
MQIDPLPWNFDEIVAAHAGRSSSLLDLGTGGGEWLAGLTHRPNRTVATESWPPNVAVAEARLLPLGIEVVQTEAARDNVDQSDSEPSGALPFPAHSFELVVSRHEAYVPREVARLLTPGGHFLTEQAGAGNDDDFFRVLGLEPLSQEPRWTLGFAAGQLEDAGLRVDESGEAEQTITFADVGAMVWYLKAIPWAVPEFSADFFRDCLEELHEREPIAVRQQRFWLKANQS